MHKLTSVIWLFMGLVEIIYFHKPDHAIVAILVSIVFMLYDISLRMEKK